MTSSNGSSPGGNGEGNGHRRPALREEERRFLFRIRVVAASVILVCIVGIIFASIFSRQFNLEGSIGFLAILIGALLALLQVEGVTGFLNIFGRKD